MTTKNMNPIERRDLLANIGASLVAGISFFDKTAWKLRPIERDSYGDFRYIDGPGEQTLCIKIDSDKLKAYPKWPMRNTNQEQFPSGSNEPNVDSISISLSKSPEAVVKEIKRRLLDDYRKTLAAILARLSARETYETKRAATIEKYAKLLGVKVKYCADGSAPHMISNRSEPISVTDFYVGSTNVNFDLDSVPHSVAEQICTLITEYNQQHQKKSAA
jgi:hypothetical protein